MTHQQQVAERLAQLRREKSARERRDVLQAEIAQAAGVSVVTYGRYENARRKIPDEVVIALAAFYGVPPGFIRYGEPVTEPSAQPAAQVGEAVRTHDVAAARALKTQRDGETAKHAAGGRPGPTRRPKRQ